MPKPELTKPPAINAPSRYDKSPLEPRSAWTTLEIETPKRDRPRPFNKDLRPKPVLNFPRGTGAVMFSRYVLFALVATFSNLATQEIAIRIVPIAPLSISILMGTIVGFVLKYVLDKKLVFNDGYSGHRQELQKIILYGAFSIFTTLAFWGIEVAFWVIWRTDFAKYTGAIIGLAIGYTAKFLLDRAFVFTERRA